MARTLADLLMTVRSAASAASGTTAATAAAMSISPLAVGAGVLGVLAVAAAAGGGGSSGGNHGAIPQLLTIMEAPVDPQPAQSTQEVRVDTISRIDGSHFVGSMTGLDTKPGFVRITGIEARADERPRPRTSSSAPAVSASLLSAGPVTEISRLLEDPLLPQG